MKKELALALLFLLIPSSVFASNFNVCDGRFALCTTAACKPIPGKKDVVACDCSVKTGYSVGTKACQPNSKTAKVIKSRYYPIKSYLRCSNDRPWAWCLDSPCMVNKTDPSKASCLCSTVQNKGDYVIVTDHDTKLNCDTGLYSSALITDVDQVNNFLKTQSEPKLYPIKVLNSQ